MADNALKCERCGERMEGSLSKNLYESRISVEERDSRGKVTERYFVRVSRPCRAYTLLCESCRRKLIEMALKNDSEGSGMSDRWMAEPPKDDGKRKRKPKRDAGESVLPKVKGDAMVQVVVDGKPVWIARKKPAERECLF